MAVQTTENAAGANPASVNFPQNVNEGTDGKGLHIDGIHGNDPNSGAGLSADLTRAAVPGLLKDDYDTDIVKMAWASTPINAMMRDMGYKKTESTVFKFYSVDMRVTEDLLTASKSLTAAQVGRNIPARVELTVANAYHFQVTDEIVFDGVNGYTADGVETPYVYLTAIVREIKGENTITAQFLNANPSGQTIPANTPISILCHAAAEEDGSVTPIAALPEPTELFAQKFMVQTQVSDVYERSAKEVTWNKSDQDEMAVQALMEDIERAYIWGKKAYITDPVTQRKTRTCSGIVEQMILGGSPVIDLYQEDLTFRDLMNATTETFVGNSGSNRRYGYGGCEVAPAIWGIKDFVKQVKVEDFKNFEYDFESLRITGYKIAYLHHPMFDKGTNGTYRNWMLVLDRQYVGRRVFRSMKDIELALEKTGAYDGKGTVWSEISAVVLKYPKTHALWIFHKGKKPSSDEGSSAGA